MYHDEDESLRNDFRIGTDEDESLDIDAPEEGIPDMELEDEDPDNRYH